MSILPLPQTTSGLTPSLAFETPHLHRAGISLRARSRSESQTVFRQLPQSVRVRCCNRLLCLVRLPRSSAKQTPFVAVTLTSPKKDRLDPLEGPPFGGFKAVLYGRS